MKKALLYIGLALVAIIIAIFILLGRYTDRVIDPYVRSLLEGTKPMGHKIEYQKIRVNLFQGSIIMKDMRMSPDSVGENKMKFEIEVAEVRLTGFKIWEMLFKKRLLIKEFIIDDPDVKVFLPLKTEEVINEVKAKPAAKPRKQLLKQIFLEKVMIAGGNFKLYRDTVLLAASDHINFLAQSINLKRNSLDEPIGYTYGDIGLSLMNLDLYAQSGLYDMEIGLFDADKNDSTIILEGFKMIPKYDKNEFSKKLKFQTDRFDVKIGRIEIAGVGFERWLAGQPLMISKITIDSVDADIYRDKNVPFDFNRFPPFYNESFLKIPVPIYLDTVLITNSRILYGELVAEHPVAGTILLEDFNLQSYGLTNQVAEDTIKSVMKFNIQAKVMGEGDMDVELILPLEGNMHDFQCSGTVGSMSLVPLNDMLQPSINMKFNGGRVNLMTFNFTANDNVSNGWMEFLYNDVDVELLKKDADKQWGFVSSLVNTVAQSDNPLEGKEMKIVEIGYERDKNKGIINYVWKTIQSGMVRTIVPTSKYQINKEEAASKNRLNRKAARTDKKLEKQDQETEKKKAKELEKTTEPEGKKKKK
jgi:hypothetical protein